MTRLPTTRIAHEIRYLANEVRAATERVLELTPHAELDLLDLAAVTHFAIAYQTLRAVHNDVTRDTDIHPDDIYYQLDRVLVSINAALATAPEDAILDRLPLVTNEIVDRLYGTLNVIAIQHAKKNGSDEVTYHANWNHPIRGRS
jgi:hypothetical protein